MWTSLKFAIGSTGATVRLMVILMVVVMMMLAVLWYMFGGSARGLLMSIARPARQLPGHAHPAPRPRRLPLRTARISALRQLVLQVPAPVIADALGFHHHTTTTRQHINAGAPWSRYVGGDQHPSELSTLPAITGRPDEPARLPGYRPARLYTLHCKA